VESADFCDSIQQM